MSFASNSASQWRRGCCRRDRLDPLARARAVAHPRSRCPRIPASPRHSGWPSSSHSARNSRSLARAERDVAVRAPNRLIRRDHAMRRSQRRGGTPVPRSTRSLPTPTARRRPRRATCRCAGRARCVRWCSAARMPTSANRPAPRSVSGTPTFTGGPPGSPVIDIRPDTPCAIRSNPPLLRCGPVCP